MRKFFVALVSCCGLMLLSACQQTPPNPTATQTSLPPETPAQPTKAAASPTPTLNPPTQTPQLIEIQKNIPYKDKLALDVYIPDIDGPRPIAVAFHGGNTGKYSLAALSTALAEMGVVVFTPDYRSSPPPATDILRGLEDATCALYFAYAYAEEHNLQKDNMIIIGHSGGGAFGWVAALANDEFPGDCLAPPSKITVKGFIGLDGAYDILNYTPENLLAEGDEETWARITPYNYLDTAYFQESLEVYLINGFVEELQRDALRFESELNAAGYHPKTMIFPDVNHNNIAAPRPEILQIVRELLFPAGEIGDP